MTTETSAHDLPAGPGLAPRWAFAVPLLLVAAIGPPAVFAGVTGWYATTGVARGAGLLALVVLCWLACCHRRPSVWAKIALYGACPLGLGVLVTAVARGGPWWAYPAMFAPPVLGYAAARIAAVGMHGPRRDLAGSAVELADHVGNFWLLVQRERIALAPAAWWLPVPRAPRAAIGYADLAYLQLGQVRADNGLVTPMLRAVGNGRELVTPVRRAQARAMFDFTLTRARRAPARRRSRPERRGWFDRHPYPVLFLGLVCWAAAVLAGVPGLAVATPVLPVAAAVACAVVGAVAVTTFARLHQRHQGLVDYPALTAPDPDPTTAPMPGWSALTPAVHPREPEPGREA